MVPERSPVHYIEQLNVMLITCYVLSGGKILTISMAMGGNLPHLYGQTM